MTLSIRSAKPDDAQAIFDFITELATYEKAVHEVKTTSAEIANSLFGEQPQAYSLIAELEADIENELESELESETKSKPIGVAIYFYNYSTWLGKQGIYLEDLYVSPQYRGLGAGKALLRKLASIAVAEGCGRVEWSVLDWNQPAIDFYQALGAKPQEEWITYRLTGQALHTFAKDG